MKLDEFIPGKKVYAMLKMGGELTQKYRGTVGHAWQGDGKKIIVKFDGEHSGWVYITEQNCSHFQLEPSN